MLKRCITSRISNTPRSLCPSQVVISEWTICSNNTSRCIGVCENVFYFKHVKNTSFKCNEKKTAASEWHKMHSHDGHDSHHFASPSPHHHHHHHHHRRKHEDTWFLFISHWLAVSSLSLVVCLSSATADNDETEASGSLRYCNSLTFVCVSLFFYSIFTDFVSIRLHDCDQHTLRSMRGEKRMQWISCVEESRGRVDTGTKKSHFTSDGYASCTLTSYE